MKLHFVKRKKLSYKRLKKKRNKLKYKKIFSKIFLVLFILFLTISIFIILFHKRFIWKKTKVCLCTIIKNENLYIIDYINHYKALGYNHLYIYDNNDINGENVEDLIKNYIKEGFVTLIDYRGYRGPKNQPQNDANYNCYENHYKEYDWLSFFDLDEYLILKEKGMKIQTLLDNVRYKLCPIVKVSWILYSDNNQLYYENKSLLERFPIPTKYRGDNGGIKSIMRGNIPYYKFNKTLNPHYLYHKVKSCSTTGTFIKGTYYTIRPTYKYAVLNHYNTKTMSEYVKKLKRGTPLSSFHLNYRILKHKFNRFFAINNKTEEKVKIFNNAFNTSFE